MSKIADPNFLSEALIRHARVCNNFLIKNYFPIFFKDRLVGFLHNSKVEILNFYKDIIDLKSNKIDFVVGDDFQSRLCIMIDDLRDKNLINKWKGDKYSVSYSDRQEVLFEVDRGASVFFGFFAYGTHLNGYRIHNRKLQLLLSRRASHLSFAPNAIDTLAGGALPLGKTPTSNLANEALEETGMDADLCRSAKPAGTVSYWWEQSRGLVPDTVYVFDIEIKSDWTPAPIDNESGGFFYADAQDVLDMLAGDEIFKPNSALVIIDFLVRYGAISADLINYHQLVELLHVPMTKYDDL